MKVNSVKSMGNDLISGLLFNKPEKNSRIKYAEGRKAEYSSVPIKNT